MTANASDPALGIPSKVADRNPAELRHDIEASKEAITDTIRKLDDHVHRAFDWRAQVGDHPYIAIGAAAATGMLIAGLFKSRPSPRERIEDALAEGMEDITHKVRNRIGAELTRSMAGGMLKTAATALVMKKVTEFLVHKATSIGRDRTAFE